ncbi:hypothetical protein [Okeania sp. SIO2B3]|uniref:hypothetical protein n=1 Tax=Okeania sp. SIO2B3 TaxID=2607784 RepID=UPI0013C2088C|nr:hypothetical protein [Okeania sp. SIO2B3]NET45196.1 hypothetical protein [Okeania sp. SIO2B3]
MEWLILIGLGVIASIGAFFYRRSRLPPSPPNRNSQTSTSYSNRHSYQREASGIQWTDVNHPEQTNQIGWVEVDVNTSSNSNVNEPETVTDENFFNQNVPDDLNNILTTVIGSNDPYSQEVFSPGETVYFCRRCRLAYHEDSWREMDCKCRDCGSDAHTRQHTLPFALQWNNIIRNRIEQ